MSPLRVLHVEDEPDIREVVEFSLALDPNLETRSCGSGQEALSVAVDWLPDIILLDVMMPIMDGPATLMRLRENAETATIPVLFMTACAQTRELDLFRSLGVAGIIPKPFDPMALAASVRAYANPVNNQFEELRDVFRQRINHDGAALAIHRRSLQSGATITRTLGRIRDIAHGLAGAGGIFGFAEISDAAATLGEAVQLDELASAEKVISALDRLLCCIERGGHSGKRPSPFRTDA